MTILAAKDVKPLLMQFLSEGCDEAFSNYGFQRRANATVYTRSFGGIEHKICFYTRLRPNYRRDALLHIMPHIEVRIPSISKKALELVDGDKWLLANAENIIINQPLDTLVPINEKESYYSFIVNDISSVLKRIEKDFNLYGLPVFDRMKSIGDFLSFSKAEKSPIIRQQHFYVFVIAAEILAGSKSSAMEIAEQKFGSTTSLRRYAALFENLKL